MGSKFYELLDTIFDRSYVGKRGEKLTERKLKSVKFSGCKGRILKNVYIPRDNGETSEIDLIYITQKGIFVIESKNYSGWIFGNEADQYWTQTLPNGVKNRFYNPIAQNRTHIKWLMNYLDAEIPLVSLIVFSERCQLKKITLEDHQDRNISILKRDALSETIQYFWSKMRDALSKKKINEIYRQLLPLTKVDQTIKQQHIQQINQKFKKADALQEAQSPNLTQVAEEKQAPDAAQATEEVQAETERAEVCPRCGAALVLRTAKKGANAGQQFYGCSAYPKCRYLKNIE